MDFLNYNNYYNLPEYTGKDTFYANSTSTKVFSILNFAFINTPLILLLFLGFGHFPRFALLGIALFLVMGISSFGHLAALNFRKVKVSEQGISMINIFGKTLKHFDWDNIEHIHALIGPINAKSGHRFYISTDPQILTLPSSYTSSSPEYMIINYRPQIIHCIIKYWNNKINYYDLPTIWKRYIEKL